LNLLEKHRVLRRMVLTKFLPRLRDLGQTETGSHLFDSSGSAAADVVAGKQNMGRLNGVYCLLSPLKTP